MCDSGVSPEFLNWSLHTVDGDDNVRIVARLIIGELDSGCQWRPAKLGGGGGESNGRKERRGKRCGVGEVHCEILGEKVRDGGLLRLLFNQP